MDSCARHFRSSTLSKILLQWIRMFPTPINRLSRNITREISVYLSARNLVPAVKDEHLRVYDVEHRTMVETHLRQKFSTASVPCMVGPETVLYIGGHPPYTPEVFSINLSTFQVAPLPSMLESRGWPGVILYDDFVYVFGGNNPQLPSSEKYSLKEKQWIRVPDMRYGRYSFTPCLYKLEIYLADCMIDCKIIEVFDVISESYRLFPELLPSIGTHSVSFIAKNEFYIIGYQFSAAKLDLEANLPKFSEIKITNDGNSRGYLGSPPLIIDDFVYYANYVSGQLTIFDINKLDLTTILDFV